MDETLDHCAFESRRYLIWVERIALSDSRSRRDGISVIHFYNAPTGYST